LYNEPLKTSNINRGNAHFCGGKDSRSVSAQSPWSPVWCSWKVCNTHLDMSLKNTLWLHYPFNSLIMYPASDACMEMCYKHIACHVVSYCVMTEIMKSCREWQKFTAVIWPSV